MVFARRHSNQIANMYRQFQTGCMCDKNIFSALFGFAIVSSSIFSMHTSHKQTLFLVLQIDASHRF